MEAAQSKPQEQPLASVLPPKIDAATVIEQLRNSGGLDRIRTDIRTRFRLNEAGARIKTKTEEHVNNRNLLQNIETAHLEEGRGTPTFRLIHAQLSKKIKASETMKQVVGEELNLILTNPARNGRSSGKEYITGLIEETILKMLVPNYVPEPRIPPPERPKKIPPPIDMYGMDLMRPNIGHKRKYHHDAMLPPLKHHKSHYYPLH